MIFKYFVFFPLLMNKLFYGDMTKLMFASGS